MHGAVRGAPSEGAPGAGVGAVGEERDQADRGGACDWRPWASTEGIAPAAWALLRARGATKDSRAGNEGRRRRQAAPASRATVSRDPALRIAIAREQRGRAERTGVRVLEPRAK
eukprot:CAMPEP_0204569710 /NCGR_PEP_ID=MMETSP0661-20131031/37904_1 /ASSEMBLY_ACC=CAM_ASM_000606 /TAXON_ID=109239 /ORGANISM="Alexandrium margalefi, Strain AMGDE01CS-322" /LENGTH=113 /DNA_ID=CAMNT_0051577837 /DNA_START=41 /DNA_END=379 /DNA_ORIENTATION=+